MDQDHFRSILAKITHEKLDYQSMPATILVALGEIMEFLQSVVGQLEKEGHSMPVACGSGCSYCCHSQINVIPVEALLIFSFVEKTFDYDEIRDLKVKIKNNQLLTAGKTFKDRVAIKDLTPCVFLGKNGQCGIYSARPLICRSWHSFDRSVCESAFVSGNHNAQIEVFEGRNYMYSSARDVFQDLSVQLDIETGIYKMSDAILNCFSMPTPLVAWLAGASVFNRD